MRTKSYEWHRAREREIANKKELLQSPISSFSEERQASSLNGNLRIKNKAKRNETFCNGFDVPHSAPSAIYAICEFAQVWNSSINRVTTKSDRGPHDVIQMQWGWPHSELELGVFILPSLVHCNDLQKNYDFHVQILKTPNLLWKSTLLFASLTKEEKLNAKERARRTQWQHKVNSNNNEKLRQKEKTTTAAAAAITAEVKRSICHDR